MALVLVLGFLSVGPAAAETATFMASKDAFVWNEVPDTNIGGHSVSEVGREGAKNAPVGLKRGLLQFGISTLPSEAIITGVTLRLFVNGKTAQEPLNLNLTVARLSADFVEGDGTSGVTWNTQPGVETSPIDIATMNSQVGDWFEMDVTAVTVVEWESGDPTNVLIRVAPTDESTVEGRWFNYRTKENGAGNDRAQLEIDYVLPTSTPTNTSTATPTSTPTPTPTFTPTQTPTNTPTPAPIGGCCAFAGVNGLSATCVDELAPEWQLPVVSIDVCLAIRNTLLDGDQILYLNRDTVCDPPGSLPGTCPTPDATPPDPVADPIVSDLVPGEGIRISGGAGSAVPGGTVWVSNPSTGEYVGANVAPDGSFTAPPIHAAMDDVLHIRVLDSTFNTSSVVQVIVGPPDPSALESPIDRTVASTIIDTTAFLYDGPLPVQMGVNPADIEPRRAAVIRGQVTNRDGEPAQGVKISILDRPEYGHTRTRADGQFDLAVNGGELMTVVYEGLGAFPMQRKVEVPWQKYTFAPEVILTEPDPQVTSLAFSASEPMHAAEGSTEGQGGASRAGVLFFPAGVEVTTIFPGETEPPTSLNVRITEYTVDEAGPNAMPGELPPTSAYTYAFEVSADEAIAAGAAQVEFTEPLPFYVENFIGFPVGMEVPLGSYNLEQSRWEPADNGMVLEVFSITDGLANLDLDGDDDSDGDDDTIAAALGITADEREALAQRYTAGESLWRVELTFFSRWDCNWPGGPPLDAIPPNGGLPSGTNDRERLDDPDASGDGEIAFQNQAVRQTVEIAGTPFTLNYQSDRQLDRAKLNTMTIPVTGATVPESLLRAEVIIDVAGRRFVETFLPPPGQQTPLPNLTTTFTWDGEDAYGRLLQGWQGVNVEVRFVYPRVYDEPANDARAFAQTSGVPIEGFSNTRAEITSGVRFSGPIGGWDAKEAGLGGWSLDVHLAYDPVSGTLNGGDGTQRTNGQVEPTIETIVGGGTTWPIVEGMTKGTAVELVEPHGITVGPDGAVYVADYNVTRRRIFRLKDGTLTTVASNLSGPFALALDGEGRSLYVTELDGHRVKRIDLEGSTIETVAGTGTPCSSDCGIGGPATQANLRSPSGLAVGRDGTLYIADSGTRILAVGTDGIIRTVASGFFNPQMDVVLAANGELYVTGGFQRVRRVTTSGVVANVAGNGAFGDGGDGLSASGAIFIAPVGLALDSDGGLFIVDRNNHRVRRVGSDGIITAVVSMEGNGPGFSGDRGPAPAAKMNEPRRVAVAPDGSLYVADTLNHRVRRITPPLPGLANLGDTVIASRDGSEVYVFDSRGRHLRTVDALAKDDQVPPQPVVLYEFDYDDQTGELESITDRDGNTTTITRDQNTITIIAQSTEPTAGPQTSLALDSDGYATRIDDPGGQVTTFEYSDNGLLKSVKAPNDAIDPGNHTTTLEYDAEGRLELRRDPADPPLGGDTLARTELPASAEIRGGYEVLHTTAEGVQTRYRVEFLQNGDERRTTLLPDGTEQVVTRKIDGTTERIDPDGTLQATTEGPDPRFGMQAPVQESVDITTPDMLSASVTSSRDFDENAGTLTETVSVSGKPPFERVYDAATRTYTDTTPEGRQVVTALDTKGRVIKTQETSLHPIRQEYDTSGRVVRVKHGPDPDAPETRRTELHYVDDFDIAEGYPASARGELKSITDAANRTVTFTYYGSGHVEKQILPDLREIVFDYDENGNVTSITPSGRPAHGFTYTAVNLEDTYSPPLLDQQSFPTTVTYTDDRQIEVITRSDGLTINLDYDPEGRVELITLQPSGEVQDLVYDETTGNLAQIIAPDATLELAFDSSLPTGEAWSGTEIAAATVTRTYDTSFRLETQQVNGEPAITFGYDDDDLLTRAGALALTPDPDNGLLSSTSITAGAGTVSDSFTYTDFAELEHYTASYDGNPIFETNYERDDLGRITDITETITIGAGPPEVKVRHYEYGTAGRLYRVCTDATCTTILSEYHYDDNGNRIPPAFTQQGTITQADYDDQDRLNSLTQGPTATTYAYTDDGDLQSKTDPGGTTTYGYDALGNLRQVELPDGTVIEYLVDGRNRRIAKKVDSNLVRQWVYQDQLNPVAELDGDAKLDTQYVYGSKANVPDYVITYDTGSGAETEKYRIISDHLGSVRLVVNVATGNVAQRIDYNEFGIVLGDTNPGFQPFGFAGGLYDSDDPAAPSPGNGLVRFGARDYSANEGRWTAKDPIGFRARSANLYGYVLQEPVNKIDSNGKQLTISQQVAVLGTVTVLSGIIQSTSRNILANLTTGVDDDELVESEREAEEPFPKVGPPEDPGEFLRLCFGRALSRFKGTHNPLRLASDLAICLGLALSH